MKNQMKNTTRALSGASLAIALFGWTGMGAQAPEVPAAIAVPAGHVMVATLVGSGDLSYECRAKAGSTTEFEWAFVGPNAILSDQNKKAVGKYYAGPTWESNDGSKITGTQRAVSPSPRTGAIPLQLVQANPSTGNGMMTGVTYVQRLNTMGGVAPAAKPCAAANVGAKETVTYQADYVFHKAR